MKSDISAESPGLRPPMSGKATPFRLTFYKEEGGCASHIRRHSRHIFFEPFGKAEPFRSSGGTAAAREIDIHSHSDTRTACLYHNLDTTLFAFREFPVARCRSEIALFNSVCARSSLLRAVVSAV